MNIDGKDLILKAKNFTKENIKPIAKEIDENNRCPEELLAPMRKSGFFKAQYPSEYGGYDMKYVIAFNIVY
jgi:alkylation response protein AidB-like acyl-CoA dehydrogenase